jgi:Sulfotransferase domain
MTSSSDWAAAARVSTGAAPDFYIVGHHKSGTTALYQMLKQHPQIYMPALKEPRFFAPDLRALLGDNGRLPSSWEEYLALFAPASPEQRRGEASPSYLRSEVAARLISRARPDARIIALLREPADFVRSLHLHLLKEAVETEPDLAAAVAREAIEREGRRVLRYSDHVRYVEQLRRYHAVFPREQVLVVIYDDFRADNQAAVRAVLRFLNVDERIVLAPVEANVGVRVRSPRLRRVVGAISSGRGQPTRTVGAALRALVPPGRARRRLRSSAERLIYSDPAPPDAAVMLELRRRFKREVTALSDYLERDLVSLWGYDRIE